MSDLVTDSLISFDNPPLHEVALGQTFINRPDFLIPYYGEFWALIKEQFPLAEHAVPIFSGAAEGLEDVPLPRVWFLSSDKHFLVQLQQDRFHLNWRRLSDEPSAYVRFPRVQRDCIQLWSTLAQFVEQRTGQVLQPVLAELTYTNLITAPNADLAAEIAEASLVNVAWPRGGTSKMTPKGFSMTLGFDLHGGQDVLQVAAAAARSRENNAELLKVDLTVKSKVPLAMSLQEWSTRAHVSLVRHFRDMTSPVMHKHWKLRTT